MLDFVSSLLQEPRLAVAAAAGVIGLAFGALSESSQFCLLGGLREARDGRDASRLAAYGVAVLAALAITQALVGAGAVDVSGSVYLATATALPGLIIGGLLFGFGAALTRGCAGRLTVLAATGNLRATLVVVVMGLAAYATMRGVFAPARLPLEALAKPDAARADLVTGLGLGAGVRFAVAAVAAAAALALVRAAGVWRGSAAIFIGGLVAAGWAASSILGDDGFEKLQPWSAAFVAPVGNGLQYLMTYTGARADFGVAFVGGVLAGAFATGLLSGRSRLVSFESPRQTVRYLAGAGLMGFGGVLALGCTTGQGLAGVSTLAPPSFVALGAIVVGMWAGIAWDSRSASATAPSGAVAAA